MHVYCPLCVWYMYCIAYILGNLLFHRFLVPGWRLGWICVHDRGDVLREVRTARLASRDLTMQSIFNTIVLSSQTRLSLSFYCCCHYCCGVVYVILLPNMTSINWYHYHCQTYFTCGPQSLSRYSQILASTVACVQLADLFSEGITPKPH